MKLLLPAALLLSVLVGCSTRGSQDTQSRPARPPSAEVASFVGEAVCASCHAREATLWKGSHHQLAMQPASAGAVLGRFDGATFSQGGVASSFFRKGGKWMARTDGPDGALHDYEITHTFGVAPLQQYLVAFPGGRLQALETAWDSRPRAEGGQRWFHLYPDEKITPTDPLHWTGAAENWNYMCADCHSTNVRKRYDAEGGRYATSFAEMSVSCEACHGPGSRHVAWATSDRRGEDGLSITLDERHGVSFERDAITRKPHRSKPRESAREIEMCARCHSRRGLLHEDHVHGQPVADDYRVALLDDDLYHPDGQIKGEVYEYGSFVQSRMFAEGVTCSDCHDPHRPELRTSGDALCLQCHATEAYFTPKHHFHAEGSAGARCVACHMPATTYMVVDARRDHSFRVPRPDLTVKLGVPNPCNGCHRQRAASWAARTVEKWYGHTPSGHQQFAEAIAAGTRGAPGAQRLLVALIDDRRQPAIARASAIARLAHQLTPVGLEAVRHSLDDPDPLVRRAAVDTLAEVELPLRAPLVSKLLEDGVRSVRIAAAAALADVPTESLPPSERAVLEKATTELVAAQELGADRPEAHLTLAHHHASRRHFDRAEAELKRALAIDPAFVPAAVNLADLYRTLDRDRDAEPVLREALSHAPDHPSLLHALGLLLVREKRLREATESLARAARRDPDNARFGYVYAVALHSEGRKREALTRLEEVLTRHPYDRDSLSALQAFYREAGNERKALECAERLAALATER
jgi:predicted CXXCH cytochrome family protein